MSLTKSTAYGLICDGETCLAIVPRIFDDREWAREGASQRGWDHTADGRDLCPECSEADR